MAANPRPPVRSDSRTGVPFQKGRKLKPMANATKDAKKPSFGTKTKTLKLGRKTFVLTKDEFKGQPQLRLQEVKPRVDGLTVVGWDREFDGVQLVAEPEAMKDFLTEARELARSLLAESDSDVAVDRDDAAATPPNGEDVVIDVAAAPRSKKHS